MKEMVEPFTGIRILVSTTLLLLSGIVGPAAEAFDEPAAPLPSNETKDRDASNAQAPWSAFGRVTNAEGQPVAGVEIWAHCGVGTLRRTGKATSGEDGRYKLAFGPGILFLEDEGPTLQAASISAHLPGHFEQNLNRQGGCVASTGRPTDEQLAAWGRTSDQVFVRDQPLELNFVMLPAARVRGTLVDEQGQPLVGYSVALDGANLPPSCSVMDSTKTDEQGQFVLEDIPTTYRYQFEVRKSNPKPPWNDSWASAALRFEQPGEDNLHAWFGDREIRLQRLIIRVSGTGMHGQTATPIAGNRGQLHLTAPAASDIIEQSEQRLVVSSGTLLLQNSPALDVSSSLIKNAVPAEAARPTKTHLARTKANADGQFAIQFGNPAGSKLIPGKHQVIFQVFVGVSENPIREKILRQVDILPDGNYEVPVSIDPALIDDSRVSIAFVTIQPEHDQWVEDFFQRGRGTRYSGMWQTDGGLLPAIPYADAPQR